MVVSGYCMVLSFVCFGISRAYWQYATAAILTGISYGTGTMIPVAILISKWFTKEKDTAIGVCSAVTGLSTLGIPSILAKSIEANGMRFTFCAEAAVCGVLMLLCGVLLRNSPEDMGLAPYGADINDNSDDVSKKKEKKRAAHDLSRTGLILMLLMILLGGGVMNVAYSHLTVLVTGEGLSENIAAVAMSFSGIALMLGKIIYGRLEDVLGTVNCNRLFGPLMLLGLGMCYFVGRNHALIYPAITVYSFGLAYFAVGLSTWPLELSSKKNSDRLVQIFLTVYSAGCLLFSAIPGIIADHSGGSYTKAYLLFLCFGIVVFVTVQTVLKKHNKMVDET